MQYCRKTLNIDPKAITPSELAQEIGMNFEVVQVKNEQPFVTPDGQTKILQPENYNLYRNDNWECVNKGVATTKGMTPIQPLDFIASYLETAKTVGATITDARVLANGGELYLQSDLPQDISVSDGNSIRALVIGTLCLNGKKATGNALNLFRRICLNGQGTFSLDGATKMRMTKNVYSKLDLLHQRTLEIMADSALVYENMLSIKISEKQAEDIIAKVFPNTKNESTRSQNIKANILESYHTGAGQQGIVGTGYGLFNGITHYLSNVVEYKSEDRMFQGMIDGTENGKILKAQKEILQLL